MMGRSHALSGAAGWLAIAPAVAAATDTAMDPAALAAGAVVCAGAALLPDLDHPSSTVARALGPASQLLAVAIATLAGGHRQATHSLAFVAAIGVGLSAVMLTPAGDPVAVVTAGLCVGLAVRALGPQQLRGGGIIDLTLTGWTVALTWIGWSHLDSVAFLPAAVALGAALHIVGDCLTPGGCPLLWPHATRHGWPVLSRTGGPAEHVVTAALGLLIAYLAHTMFGPALPVAHAAGLTLANPPMPLFRYHGQPASFFDRLSHPRAEMRQQFPRWTHMAGGRRRNNTAVPCGGVSRRRASVPPLRQTPLDRSGTAVQGDALTRLLAEPLLCGVAGVEQLLRPPVVSGKVRLTDLPGGILHTAGPNMLDPVPVTTSTIDVACYQLALQRLIDVPSAWLHGYAGHALTGAAELLDAVTAEGPGR